MVADAGEQEIWRQRQRQQSKDQQVQPIAFAAFHRYPFYSIPTN
jgi:hypothetical protein